MSKGASSLSRDKNAHVATSAGSTNSNLSISKKDKSGGIWKKRPILIAVSGFFIVALVVFGIIALQNPVKDKSIDNLGSSNTATDSTPTPPPPTTTNSVEILDMRVTNITDSSLTMLWKTNVPSTTELIAEEQKSKVTVASWPDNNLVLEHKIVLERLQPATVYILRIKSKDASGNQATVEINQPYQTLAIRLSTDIVIGQHSPDFLLQTVSEESIRLSDFQGKWVMIVFWMTSCNECRDELPHLNKFWTNSKLNNFVLLTINVGGQETLNKNYVKSQNLTFPVLLDQGKEVSGKYTVAKFPTIFLIDPDGIVRKIREDSFKSEAEIDAFVRSVIKSN